MKVVKLNSKFKRFREGYTHAMRWDRWDYKLVSPYEKYFARVHGYHGYSSDGNAWFAGFGDTRDRVTKRRPYFIYVSHEHLITAALLAV